MTKTEQKVTEMSQYYIKIINSISALEGTDDDYGVDETLGHTDFTVDEYRVGCRYQLRSIVLSLLQEGCILVLDTETRKLTVTDVLSKYTVTEAISACACKCIERYYRPPFCRD